MKKELYFTLHILKHKNLSLEEKDVCKQVIKNKTIDKKYSKNNKTCFKLYVKSKKTTYFVITSISRDYVKVITFFKKKGKH